MIDIGGHFASNLLSIDASVLRIWFSLQRVVNMRVQPQPLNNNYTGVNIYSKAQNQGRIRKFCERMVYAGTQQNTFWPVVLYLKAACLPPGMYP